MRLRGGKDDTCSREDNNDSYLGQIEGKKLSWTGKTVMKICQVKIFISCEHFSSLSRSILKDPTRCFYVFLYFLAFRQWKQDEKRKDKRATLNILTSNRKNSFF